jgi:hypothetical protein
MNPMVEYTPKVNEVRVYHKGLPGPELVSQLCLGFPRYNSIDKTHN